MKQQPIHSDKKLISNTIFFLFILLVCGVGYMSDSMKIPHKTHSDFIEETQAFNNKELTHIHKIFLKNNNGEFVFDKNDETQKWNFSSLDIKPKESIFMDKFFANLQTIKTKNVLEQTPANLNNLSLLNPQVTLTLLSLDDQNQQKEIIVYFGLMNTIDNSTYISFKNKKGIFHVEAPAGALENVTLADIIETRPFEINPSDVKKLKITTFYPKSQTLDFEKIEGIWTKRSDVDVNQAMIEEYLNDLIEIKSAKVLISKSKAQAQNIKDLLKKYPFEISITLNNEKTINYQITATTKSFSEISLNDEYHYAITRSDDDSTHFIRSDNQAIFTINP